LWKKKTGKKPFETDDLRELLKGNDAQRLELMLVLISFTVSAKAGSFFIFFST
jgi:hypothetical protein